MRHQQWRRANLAKSMADQRLLAALAIVSTLGVSQASAAEGAWKFEVDNRDQPVLTYIESGKEIFMMGCGRAFGLHVRYPATPKKEGRATVTLANSRTRMTFVGEFEEPDATSATTFLPWDLGYRRQDPRLYGTTWKRERDRLLDLLASGPITVSAEGRSYQLPAAGIPGWREAFHQCG
jgi:hypothetical protein